MGVLVCASVGQTVLRHMLDWSLERDDPAFTRVIRWRPVGLSSCWVRRPIANSLFHHSFTTQLTAIHWAKTNLFLPPKSSNFGLSLEMTMSLKRMSFKRMSLVWLVLEIFFGGGSKMVCMDGVLNPSLISWKIGTRISMMSWNLEAADRIRIYL